MHKPLIPSSWSLHPFFLLNFLLNYSILIQEKNINSEKGPTSMPSMKQKNVVDVVPSPVNPWVIYSPPIHLNYNDEREIGSSLFQIIQSYQNNTHTYNHNTSIGKLTVVFFPKFLNTDNNWFRSRGEYQKSKSEESISKNYNKTCVACTEKIYR